MDYIFAISRKKRDLGTLVSSLYGAPRLREVPTVLPVFMSKRFGLHRYPREFTPTFP